MNQELLTTLRRGYCLHPNRVNICTECLDALEKLLPNIDELLLLRNALRSNRCQHATTYYICTECRAKITEEVWKR